MLCIDFRGNQVQCRLYAGDLVDPARRSAFLTKSRELLSRLTEARFKALEHQPGYQWANAVLHQTQGQRFSHRDSRQVDGASGLPVPTIRRAFIIAVQWKHARQFVEVSLNRAFGRAVAGLFQLLMEFGGGQAWGTIW